MSQTAKQASNTAAKINAIRAAAGNPMVQCPTCTHAALAPYIRSVGGKVVEGCIDAFHNAASIGPAARAWHDRPEAREIRRNTLAALSRLNP